MSTPGGEDALNSPPHPESQSFEDANMIKMAYKIAESVMEPLFVCAFPGPFKLTVNSDSEAPGSKTEMRAT